MWPRNASRARVSVPSLPGMSVRVEWRVGRSSFGFQQMENPERSNMETSPIESPMLMVASRP